MIQPLGTNVLVKPEKPKDKTEGGIFIPTSIQGQGQNLKVEIIGIGPDVDTIKVGDIGIIGGIHHGTEIKVGEEFYRILDIDSIIAIQKSQ